MRAHSKRRWTAKTLVAIFLVAILSGCVSSVMAKYVGKDIREVFIEHGKPIHTFDLEDGRRVFQFRWGESSAGSSVGRKGGCLISYITVPNEKNDSWIVDEYRYPDRLIC